MAKNAQHLGWQMNRRGDNAAALSFQRSEAERDRSQQIPDVPTPKPRSVADRLKSLRDDGYEQAALGKKVGEEISISDRMSALRDRDRQPTQQKDRSADREKSHRERDRDTGDDFGL